MEAALEQQARMALLALPIPEEVGAGLPVALTLLAGQEVLAS